MKQSKTFAAALIAEQVVSHGYDRRQFKTTPNMVALTLQHADGDECRLSMDDSPLLAEGRRVLFCKVLLKVQRHLKKEQRLLRKQRRSL